MFKSIVIGRYNIMRIREVVERVRFKWASMLRGDLMTGGEADMALGVGKGKKREKVSIKMQEYPELNKFFIRFLNSAENAGRTNGQNLVFLTGASQVGKTTYADSNLDRFRRLKQ
jgi:hypothetical protein